MNEQINTNEESTNDSFSQIDHRNETMPKTTTTTTTTTKVTKKRSKDPHAPKRFRTAYLLFSNEKREEVKRENPSLSAKEVMGELAALWKSADANTKQRFQKLSDTEKNEYEEKMAAYKSEQHDKQSANKENLKKSKKKSMKNNDEDEISIDD